jgi:hypothetical protein
LEGRREGGGEVEIRMGGEEGRWEGWKEGGGREVEIRMGGEEGR